MNVGRPLREVNIELEEYEKALPATPDKPIPASPVAEPVPA